MRKLLTYLPLHFTVCVIFGICFQFFTEFWNFGFAKILLSLAILATFILLLKNSVLRTIVSFILFFFIGISVIFINDDRNYTTYYTKYLKENSSVILQIQKVLKPGLYHTKFEAKVIQVDSYNTKGTILLNVKKDSIEKKLLQVGDQVLSKPTLQEIPFPLNPNQFNYRFYLEKQGIYQQVFLSKNHFTFLKSNTTTLYGLAARFRNHIQISLKKYHFKNDELGVMNALLLGQRSEISKELISNYQKAGAIHILAVSGLHIGIILLLLSFLLKPIEYLKYGVFIKTVLLVVLLWLFALIAGLSASVVRAVTMFTFVAIGMSFKTVKTIEFSIISSIFFLLIIKPMLLFDVGFQLSYLAVFGIVWVQPKLYRLVKIKNKVFNFFWQLFTVSLAAQIGILPLIIYYFQQFPGLFLLTNLVIIPLLGSILIGGILVIFGSVLKILPQFIADIYGFIIANMNSFISWISHQEEFLFKNISISVEILLGWYVLIFMGIQFFINKSYKKLLIFFFSIILVQSLYLWEKKHQQLKKEMIVFHKSRHSIIGKRIGQELYLQHNIDSLKGSDEFSFRAYKIANDIKKVHQIYFKNYTEFANKEILIIDSLGIYNLKKLKNPIVVLQFSPKINITRMIKKLNPSKIIADGSNYTSDVARWEQICRENNIPFHATSKNGAFILSE